MGVAKILGEGLNSNGAQQLGQNFPLKMPIINDFQYGMHYISNQQETN
jgi:hypothetical protein